MSIAANLKKFREKMRLSQTALAKAAGVSQQSISRLESELDLTTKYLPQIARALGVQPHDIDPDYAPDPSAIPAARVPVISWVRAGALAAPDAEIDMANAKRISVPGLDPSGEWIALIVEGDSMDRISPPDSTIVVNLKDHRLVANACYVVATEDGAATYKRYRPGTAAQWHPVSTNPKHKPLTAKQVAGLRVVGRVKKTMLDM